MISIKQIGTRSLERKFKRISDKLGDLRLAHKKAKIVLLGWIQNNFNKSGRLHEDQSLHWKELSQMTINMRRKGKGSGDPKPLLDTGALRRDWEVEYKDKEFTLKSKKDYSGLHEEGGNANIEIVSFNKLKQKTVTSRGIKVPQRKILPEKNQARDIVYPVYERYIRNSINK